MQSRISCSAGKLSLLHPEMIQQIVADVAYKSGAQYADENRVRIMSSDEGHVASSVTGNFWMHEQDIRLKDGFLVATCSCRVEEQPMCRHSIAALLAYHKTLPQTSAKAASKFKREAVVLEATVVEAVKTVEPAAKESEPAASPPRKAPSREVAEPAHSDSPGVTAKDLKFSDIAMFIEWLQPTVEALKHGRSMPGLPRSAHGDIEEWILALLNLETQKMHLEASQNALRNELAALKTDFADKSQQLERTTQKLQVANRDARDAQATCTDLQSKLSHCHGIITGLQDLGRQLDQCEGQIKAMGEELTRKKAQHDLLSGSFRDIASALRPLGKAAAAITG
jgi:hypothetical protein